MKKIQGTYDELVDHYATLTSGRCAVLVALLVALFLFLGGTRNGDGSRNADRRRPPPSPPRFREDTTMFFDHRRAQIDILPGHFEPRNLAPRVTFAAICDFSGSMNEHAERLPPAWQAMVNELNEQTETRQRAMLACCGFDDRVAVRDYAPLSCYRETVMDFSGGGTTHLATALLTTIKCTDACRKKMHAAGVTCYRSLIAVITDGQATDRAKIPEAVRQIAQAERRRAMDFVFIAPSVDDVDLLQQLFGKKPLLLDELDYEALFRGFAESLSVYSQSIAGAEPDGRTLIASHLDTVGRGTLLSGPDSAKQLLKPWS